MGIVWNEVVAEGGLFLSLKHLRNNIIGIISRIDDAKNNMAVATSAPPASGVLPVD